MEKRIKEIEEYGFREIAPTMWTYPPCPAKIIVSVEENLLTVSIEGKNHLVCYVLEENESILDILLNKLLYIGSWIKKPKT